MSDEIAPSRRDPSRQLRQRIDSLRASGIEWVPNPTTGPGPTPHTIVPAGTAQQSTLFGKPVEPESRPDSPEQRRQELRVLAQTVSGCTRCNQLAATRTQTVFGVGAMDPLLCFVGEAPGADEDRQGEPFVGQAGQFLNRIIAACGFRREDVYICNIIKCRPPGNRPPLPSEAGNCQQYLDRQLDLVRPKFLCALGATAAQNLLNTRAGIGKLRGRFYEYRGIPVVCTYHPAALLPGRSPERKKDVWEDMKILLARMGRPIPGT